jgi:hypothetical protein
MVAGLRSNQDNTTPPHPMNSAMLKNDETVGRNKRSALRVCTATTP